MNSYFDTVNIEWLSKPKDCFFQDSESWYPGWAIAKVHLPYAQWTHIFYLVQDFSGIAYWKARVSFREESLRRFDQYPNLDWTKIERLAPITKN